MSAAGPVGCRISRFFLPTATARPNRAPTPTIWAVGCFWRRVTTLMPRRDVTRDPVLSVTSVFFFPPSGVKSSQPRRDGEKERMSGIASQKLVGAELSFSLFNAFLFLAPMLFSDQNEKKKKNPRDQGQNTYAQLRISLR